MEKKIKLSTEIPLVVLSMVPLVMTFVLWNRLPDRVPMHWNLDGKIDGYGPKLLMPLLNIGIYALLLVVMFIDPKKENYSRFMSIYTKLRIVILTFFLAVSSVIILVALGYPINTDRFFLVSIPLLLALTGNFLINIKPNWMIGVRTPWTLSSENVWRKTHRLTGTMWFWSGLACLVMTFFVDTYYSYRVLFAVIMTTVVISIIYSFLIFRKEKQTAKHTEK